MAKDMATMIVEKRRQLGLTQEGAARLIGVTSNTVARWERGEMNPRGTCERAVKDFLRSRKSS